MNTENTILIGSKAYQIKPLTVKQHKRVSGDILKVVDGLAKDIDSNGRGLTVGEIFAEALWKSGVAWGWIEMITGIPVAEIKERMIHNQLKYFLAVFCRLNMLDRIDQLRLQEVPDPPAKF